MKKRERIERLKEEMQSRDYEGVITVASACIFDLLEENRILNELLSKRSYIDFVHQFEIRFGEVTEENLAQAVDEDPQFLADFICFAQIKPLTQAVALAKLGHAHYELHLGLFKTFTKSGDPLVREGAFQGLSEYYFNGDKKHADLIGFFKRALEKETSAGVQKQVRNLIEAMEMYT